MPALSEEFASGFDFQAGSGEITLFHGSKSGIHGAVSPFRSRVACDFGQGFYLGTKKEQAKGLISLHDNATLYTCSLNLWGLNILKLDGLAWALTVAYCRGVITEFPNIAKYIEESILKSDIIVGAIADDELISVVNYSHLFESYGHRTEVGASAST